MAKMKFLKNLNTARHLFWNRVNTSRPARDPATVESQMDRATSWLTPSSVRGFDIRDFAELPPAAKTDLQTGVERFRQVAKQVPPTQPANATQTQEAMTALLQVFEILNPYYFPGDESQRLQEVMESLALPEWVLTWEFEFRFDFSGDPAVWIWIIVDDQAAAREDFMQQSREVREKLRTSLWAAGIQHWPLIHFRTAGDQRSL
jgi:hypothetical protein